MKNLENIAKHCGFKIINLEDSSEIEWNNYKINLAYLNIMKYGISYYSRFGFRQYIYKDDFIQDTFDEDLNHWNIIKEYPFIETLQSILNNNHPDQLKSKNFKNKVFENINELLLSEYLSVFNDETIGSVGSYIYDHIRFNKDNDKNLNEIIFVAYDIIKSLINYGNSTNSNLTRKLI